MAPSFALPTCLKPAEHHDKSPKRRRCMLSIELNDTCCVLGKFMLSCLPEPNATNLSRGPMNKSHPNPPNTCLNVPRVSMPPERRYLWQIWRVCAIVKNFRSCQIASRPLDKMSHEWALSPESGYWWNKQTDRQTDRQTGHHGGPNADAGQLRSPDVGQATAPQETGAGMHPRG